MRFGGVDPSIIRELSGIYKPFPKAFKELVSNAFDADAQRVEVRFDQARRSLSVVDDGCGMTPFEFRRDFTKIGGSEKSKTAGRTALGRLRIGCKGIGFLAVARYCARMVVRTHGPRVHVQRLAVEPNRIRIPLGDRLDVVVPSEVLKTRLQLSKVSWQGGTSLKLGRDVEFDAGSSSLSLSSKIVRRNRPLEVVVEVDCRGLAIKALLDFEKLLKLAHSCDLYDLDSFCELDFERAASDRSFTTVELQELYGDVLNDLTRDCRGGNAKSIEVRSGREHFQWHLGRTVPLKYPVTHWTEKGGLLKAEADKRLQALERVELVWNDAPPTSLTRQIFASDPASLAGQPYSVIPVEIDEPGLRADGYLLALSEVISPPEYRGITVRVRNVAIGDPHFFGLERVLTGAQRAALNQITGEVAITEGLDTPDALNPGRESFYEENPQAKRLRELIAGKPGTLGGLIRRAVKKVLDHSEIASRAQSYLAQAARRRQALLDVAAAINHYSFEGYEAALAQFFALSASVTNCALRDAPTVALRPPTRVQEFSIQNNEDIKEQVAIDQDSKRILFNYKQEVWDQQLFILGEYFKVEAKKGLPRDPLCEFDVANRTIYVNWAHPLKRQADEAQYLKQAILWTLAFEAAEKPKQVMELGLALLTHQEG